MEMFSLFLKRRIFPCLIAFVSLRKGQMLLGIPIGWTAYPDPEVWWPDQAEINGEETTQQFTVGASASHFVKLLPREGALHTPGPDRSLFLNCILKNRLEREEHTKDVLGTLHAHVHNWKDRRLSRPIATRGYKKALHEQPRILNHLDF